MSESDRARGYSNLPETETQLQNPEEAVTEGDACQVRKPSLCKRILRWRRYLMLVLTPISLMPIPIAIPGKVSKAVVA